MIIVEGMDNSGKTTLVARLSEDLKLLVMNNRRRPSTSSEGKLYLRKAAEMSKNLPLILDRLCTISEPIYGPICRGSYIYSDAELAEEYSFLLAEEPLIIYCRPSDEAIFDFGDRPQMDGVIQRSKQLLGAYDLTLDQLALTGFTVAHWDYETYEYSWIMNQVINHLEKPHDKL